MKKQMREIKFRGKAIDGFWEYGSLWIDKGKYYINGTDNNWWWVIPDTVGQYTGLKDKNDTEIYEGDILAYKELLDIDTKNPCKTIVRFNNGTFWNSDMYFNANIYTFEIIGNIYEGK